MSRRTRNRRWTIAGIAALAAIATLPVISIATGGTASADAPVPGDGRTSQTAGASCWGIKKAHPDSADGPYWLSNSSMDRPAQFHCDMTTDGGGWVLIARGRDGWTFNPNGQGSASTLRNQVDGPAAFSPAALDTDTITGLLGDRPMTSLSDGIRLRRATNSSGTNRQEIRLHGNMSRWTWNFPAGQLLNRVVIDGTTYNGSNTQDTRVSVQGQTTNQLSSRNDQRRIWTTAVANKNNRQGFGMGTVSGGSNSSSNHLWTAGSEGSPLGFTQVWLRPEIANGDAGFSPIPAAGHGEELKPLSLKNRSEVAPWGVSGLDHTGETSASPWWANVLSVQTLGDRVFVGGRFTHVQKGPSGPETPRRYLAAFDLEGNWISDFDPVLDGRVWAMTATEDGKLIVGGDFTTVDGTDRPALVALDPLTGEIDTSWNGRVERPGGEAVVRALHSSGDRIWATGRFTRAFGGGAKDIKVSSAIDFRSSDAEVGIWKPTVHASAVDLELSADGSRMLMAGYFAAVNNDASMGYFAITDSSTGAVIGGTGPFIPSEGTRNSYQLGVTETPSGDLVVGGSEHSLQLYDANRSQLLDSHITRQGGDFQFAEEIDGYIYAGCHCLNWNYQGTNSWSNPRGFRSVDPIRFIARYDAETFDLDTTWYPNGTKGSRDDGPWSISLDQNRCLWMGGDFTRGAYSGNAERDYLGGFARFCPTDDTAPSAPTNLTATTTSSGVDLEWNAATDDSGSVAYDIYRNDRVIATVYGTSFSDPQESGADGQLLYTVRAADARGNRSASPAPVAVNGPAPTIDAPISWGATWSYDDTGTDLGTDWTAVDLDDSAWAEGEARLGWGGSQKTAVGPDHPTTTYYRSSFDLANASAIGVASIELKVSQGAVVHLNGVEIGRTNMPDGPVGHSTVASMWIGGSDNERVKTFTAPGELLRDGLNVIAVEVHGWRTNSGVTVFDGQVNLSGPSTSDTEAPSQPVAEAEAAGDEVLIRWTPSTDDVGVAGYLLSRDGVPVRILPPGSSEVIDPVSPTEPRSYVVTAFDAAGNATASEPVQTDAVTAPTVLLERGSEWHWLYPDDVPAPDWAAPAFDASSWNVGAGDFGFGEASMGTVISTAPAPRSLTSYYRTQVEVEDPSQFSSVALDLVRNAGAVVYVNGVEVARSNMPDGPVVHGTYSLQAPSSATRRQVVPIDIPAEAFTAGTNTIAVELHLGWRSQPTAGFDLGIIGLPAN